jgi:hypothetical protein
MVRARHSAFRLASTAAVFLALSACGDDARPGAPVGKSATPLPEEPAPRGERTELSAETEEETRQNALEWRDTPLAVGAQAPTFSGYPEKAVAVIVFFRGEW